MVMNSIFIFVTNIVLAYSFCPFGSFTSGGSLACSSSFYMIDSKICVNSCPTNFMPAVSDVGLFPICYPPSDGSAIYFTFELASVKDLTANFVASLDDSSTQLLNPDSIPFNSPTQKSPLPTIDRGFYFAKTSSTSINQNYIPSLYFTLNLWIKPLDSGEILSALSGSEKIRIWADSSGFYSFYAQIYDSNNDPDTISGSSMSSYTSFWQFVSISLNQASCSQIDVTFLINSNDAGIATFTNREAKFSDDVYTWTIGDIHNSDSFRGFIYWIEARSSVVEYDGGLSINIECIDNQYWDGSSCMNCDANCPTWPWCIRGTDCITCNILDCATCQGYPPLECVDCKTGVAPNCCDYLGTVCSQTWTNTDCDSGKFLIGGVCLHACPYGFGNCVAISTAVMTVDFSGSFAGRYGVDLITAASPASYNYWNSPETSDPFPAKNRGLYFNSNQFLSGSINLSNTWSMSLWVYAISGIIISHSSGKLTIDPSGINFSLEKWDGTSASYSASQSIPLNVWCHISYSVGFGSKLTTVTPYLNKIAGSSQTVADYVFRLQPGGTLYIGKGSTKFKGFIAHFILWQVTISDFSSYYDINTLTGGLVSTLWPCDYSHYYDGSTCKSCLDSTCTNGCTRGNSCYICDDFLCSQCSSFWSGACTLCIDNASGTPCQCNSGFYQPTNQALCSACYTGCADCTGSGYYLCTACSSSYFLYNSMICLPDCPSGYNKNSGTNSCDFSSSTSLSLYFYNEIQLSSLSGARVGYTSTNIYPTYDNEDPFPAYLRGYYFYPSSLLTRTIMISPTFSIAIWIKATVNGFILVKYVPTTTQWYVQILPSGKPKLWILLSDTSTTISVIGNSSIIDAWSFVSFDCKINLDGTTTIVSYINSVFQASTSSATALYLIDIMHWNFYIGHLTQSFTGFLWELKIYTENGHHLDDWRTTGCTGSCTKCATDLICQDNCPFSQYFDGTSCANCIATCDKGCRNSDTCRICKTKECATCIEFSGGSSCLTCITNAVSDGSGGCTCAANAFWVSSSQTCEFCDAICSICLKTTYFECSNCLGSYQLVGSVCLNDCPYGFDASCSSVSTAVINESFNTDFQGSYGIFTSGTISTSFQFFNTPESFDPIPAYNRGLYFDGNMYLLSSTSVLFSHSFSIGAWVYVIVDGDLLEKQTRFVLSSTGSIKAIMEDPSQAVVTETLSSSTSFTDWSYLSVTFSYTSGITTITIYINGASVFSLPVSNYIYRDLPSTSLMLGKSSSSYFTGFIRSFQLWNIPINTFAIYMDNICGGGHSCLWSCDLFHYLSGSSYLPCNSCSKGCRRAQVCNICYDLLCLVCTGFDSGKCTQCASNASKISGSCFCNAGYVPSSDGLSCICSQPSSDGLSCVICFNGCSQCTDSAYHKCTACYSGYYFFALTGQCLNECPSGYIINSGANSCDKVSDLGVSLDLTDQIRLDTVSSFNVGSDYTNTYPDWTDVNDPIPSYKRGYYFNTNSYLMSSAMISPSFTVLVWIKPLVTGIFITKCTSTDIFTIKINSSGFPWLSITFSDSSSGVLSASTSILNSWHFLCFSGSIASDGTTNVVLYINTLQTNYITSSISYFKDTHIGQLFLGNNQISGATGFKGFLARLMIYNSNAYQNGDYSSSCNTGCSACPSNNQCLSECDFDKYPDSCSICNSGCNKGCVDNLSCNLCRDKECNSCTNFSGECTSCIANAYKLAGHCKCLGNALWVSSSQSCELCNSICASCSTFKFDGCQTCISGYYLIQSLCMPFCPTGYIKNGNNCDADTAYTNFFVFNMMPHQIKDIVADLKSNIPILTGKDNKFYPTYDATDPIATIYRGYYFSGSSYMQLPPYQGTALPLFTFSPKFVISTWIKPISGTGVIFSKQTNSGGFTKYVSLELIDKIPTLILSLKDLATITYKGASPLLEASISQWNFISVISDVSTTPQQIINLSINQNSDLSSDIHASWFIDLGHSFFLTIGAYYIDSSQLASFFNGFIWDLKIYNTPNVGALVSSTCNGCSLCPIDNSNTCLDSCLIDKYWNGNSCVSCLSSCLSNGCVRSDKNCNLCYDVICDICDDYTSTCHICKANSNFIGTSCQCNSGYYWNTSNESCELIKASCELDYNGTINCTEVIFYAKLAVLSDNSLYLLFSESLANNLTLSDFNITIENLGKIASQIEERNSTCYYISLKIKETVSKGTLITLEFLDLTKVRSISNRFLNSSEVYGKLNSYDQDSYLPAIESVASRAEAGSQGVVFGAIALSFVGASPSSLWSIINTLQILSFLTLSGIPFSSKLRSFLNNLNSFNLFPNIFEYFLDENEGNTPYSQAKDFGFDSDLILINQGTDFTIILASIAALPLILFFSRCSYKWIGKKFRKTLKAYQYAFYIRFWIQCYLELGAASCIGLLIFNFSNATQISNFIICISLAALLFITPGLCFWFSYKNKNRIQSREKTLFSLFSELFYEFRSDRGFLATQYYFVFFARRLIYILNLVYLRDYPQTEVTVNIVLSLVTIMHLAICWLYKDPILQVTNLTTEILISWIMGSTAVYLFDLEESTITIVDNIIIITVIVAIAIQTFASIAIFARTLYRIIRNKLAKEGFYKKKKNESISYKSDQI